VVYTKSSLSRADASVIVDLIFEEICTSLVSGENVKLSNFGVFTLRDKNRRIGRNPKTKEEVEITPRRVVSFTASTKLRFMVANNLSRNIKPAF